MKTLKFFLLAVVAVVFFACEQPTTGPSFSVMYNGQEIAEGAVIDVTMDHYEWGEIVAHVILRNNASGTETFTMKEVRNYDYTKYIHSNMVIDEELGLYHYHARDYWYIGLTTKNDFIEYKLTDYKKTWFVPSDFKAKLVKKEIWHWKWSVKDEQ